MTTPVGSIVFNNSTGSDTAASGLGPATAISGTGASLNATSAVDLSADSPDLSGITAGMLLWVDTSSGREFSIIASVDNGTKIVTCDDAYGVTESSRNWGIGGKRSSLTTSTQLFNDIKAGWTVDIEETGSAYVGSSGTSLITLGVSGDQTSGYIHITSSSAAKPILRAVDNANTLNLLNRSYVKISNLQLEVSGSSGGSCISNSTSSGWAGLVVYNCELTQSAKTGTANGILLSANTFDGALIEKCYIHDLNSSGISIGNLGGGNDKLVISHCNIINNNINIEIYTATYLIINSIVAGAIGDGIAVNALGINRNIAGTIVGCIIYGNGDDGLSVGDVYGQSNMLITGNIFYSNTGYGIRWGSSVPVGYFADRNAFGSNTAGDRLNISAGSNDVTLTGDPFVDAANGDFNINNTSGAGAALRAVTVTL